MQPKKYKNPLIATLNIELELKAEKDNAEMRISNVDEYQNVCIWIMCILNSLILNSGIGFIN